MTGQYDYDLFVIGAGSGGVRAARVAAQNGARVAIAEEYRIGGTCVIRGCVPKKLFVYASEFSQAFKDAKGFGWTVEWARFDWATLRDNVQNEVARLESLYRANLEKAGVAIFEDRAEVTGPNSVKLVKADREIKAQRILVATGGTPFRPEHLTGVEHVITSEEAFLLPELPTQIMIAGGGYIAVEFATIFAGLGVETTLVYRGDLILRGFDRDLRIAAQTELERSGVRIITNAVLTDVKPLAEGRLVTLSNDMQLETGAVMMALGRAPYVQGLGLENAGVKLTERGAVNVDSFSRTNVPSIFAVGDVTDRINLTPVAIREGQAFAQTEFMNTPTAFDHADVASAVFGRPPLGAVGLTEEQARARFGEVHIYKTSFRPMKNVLAGNDTRSFMKLIVHPRDERILGVHLAGPEAPELIQLAAVAVKAELTKPQWDSVCAVHPTAAEELVLMRERST